MSVDVTALQTALTALNTEIATVWQSLATGVIGSNTIDYSVVGSDTSEKLSGFTSALATLRGNVQTAITGLGLDSDLLAQFEALWAAYLGAKHDAELAAAIIQVLG